MTIQGSRSAVLQIEATRVLRTEQFLTQDAGGRKAMCNNSVMYNFNAQRRIFAETYVVRR
jgi:hypothetical protein